MNNEKYKNVTIQGSSFPDATISNTRKITLSKEINNEYIPILNTIMESDAYGFRLLLTIMAYQEGFFKVLVRIEHIIQEISEIQTQD